MICERCYQPDDIGEHGLYRCPLEPRRNVTATIWPDDIPGGVLIEHGLCNADGSARRFDSRSAIRREAAAKGLMLWGDQFESSRTKDGQAYLEYRRSGEYARVKRERMEQRFEQRSARPSR